MAVKIKLQRLGKIREPFYRVIVADARTRRDGRAIETIGKYDPTRHPSLIEVNSERAQHWLSVGAQPTEPVMAILKVTGDWQKYNGLPGAEGTLQQPEQKPSKQELFNAALAQAGEEPSAEATTPKKKGGGRKSAATSEAKPSEAKPSEDKASEDKASEDKPAEEKASEDNAEPGKQEQA